jgi:hypothetical protein
MLDLGDNWTRAIAWHIRPLVLVLCLTLFLALQGGAPFHHPDSLVHRAEKTMANQGNPGFFHYPALMLYLNGAVCRFHDFILQTLPRESSNAWPYENFPGQLLTALFSVIGALSVYGIGYLLTRSKPYALVAALLLVTSPLWNADSHYITVDIPLAALCSLTLFALVHVVERKGAVKTRHIALLGILIGLAASTKYNGALIASAVMSALLVRVGPLFRTVGLIVLCGLIAIATFLLVNPFVIIEFDAFTRDFMYEVNHVTQGHMGFTVDTVHYHLTVSLKNGWGTLLMLLSGLGAALLLVNKSERLHTKLAVIVFPLLYLTVLFRTRLSFQRYALTLIPFLAVLAMYAVFQLGRYAKTYLVSYQSRIVMLSSTILVVIAFGMNLYQTQRHNILLGRKDTRAFLQEVFRENSNLLRSRRASAGRYAKLCLRGLVDFAEPRGLTSYDILIADSFSLDRHIYDKRTTPDLTSPDSRGAAW